MRAIGYTFNASIGITLKSHVAVNIYITLEWIQCQHCNGIGIRLESYVNSKTLYFQCKPNSVDSIIFQCKPLDMHSMPALELYCNRMLQLRFQLHCNAPNVCIPM